MKIVDNKLRIIKETPKGSHQKYDYDAPSGLFLITKLMPAGMVFPFDFGFIPATQGEDGDPLDVLLLSEIPAFTGAAVDCRIIGAFNAVQRERDGKLTRNDRYLAVPIISQSYAKVHAITDLDKALKEEIAAFFVNYNLLGGKSFSIKEEIGTAHALDQIEKAKMEIPSQQYLVSLFLPLNASSSGFRKLRTLESQVSKKFGGVSIYNQSPVSGLWNSDKSNAHDELIVVEVMCPVFDQTYWKALKAKLETELKQEQILIRWSRISTFGQL